MMTEPGPFVPFIACFLGLFIVNNSHAQGCCGIGGSLVSGGYPVPDRYTLLASASGNYADADKPERLRGSAGFLLAYGITDRLSLSLKTSYIWASYSIDMPPFIFQGDTTYPGKKVDKNNGFGDGYAAIQYAIIRLTPMNKQELIAGMDAGIPWGPDKKKDHGVVLVDNVQTGSGGFSLNGYLTYLKAFPAIYYSVTATVAGRVNFTTRRGKDPGDEFSVMMTSLLGPLFNTRASVTFNYSRNGTDYSMEYSDDMQIAPGTSGKRLSFIPALEYSFSKDLKILVNADLPLWRDKYDASNNNDKSFSAQVYWFFHFAEGDSYKIRSISF